MFRTTQCKVVGCRGAPVQDQLCKYHSDFVGQLVNNEWTRRCARPNCNGPSSEPHRGSAGLCKQHAEERKERQRRTKEHVKCPCGNVARAGESYCGACIDRRKAEAEPTLEEQVKGIRSAMHELLDALTEEAGNLSETTLSRLHTLLEKFNDL